MSAPSCVVRRRASDARCSATVTDHQRRLSVKVDRWSTPVPMDFGLPCLVPSPLLEPWEAMLIVLTLWQQNSIDPVGGQLEINSLQFTGLILSDGHDLSQ
jgi:hypothetical protein